MPATAQSHLRLHLLRMARANLTGVVNLHINGGRCVLVRPHHSYARGLLLAPSNDDRVTEEMQLVLDEVLAALMELQPYNLDGKLIVRVDKGVPQMPVDIEFDERPNPQQLPPRQPPRGYKPAQLAAAS